MINPDERTIDDCDTSRERIAFILQDLAENGLPGPRDLDVALDAIDSEYGRMRAMRAHRLNRILEYADKNGGGNG